MHNHHQHDCDHELKFCRKCDAVYCGKCGKEWRVSYTFTSRGSGSTAYLSDMVNVTNAEHEKHI